MSDIQRSIRLKCGTLLPLSALEDAHISYVPCGQIDGEDRPLFTYANLWGARRRVTMATYGKRAHGWTLAQMTGVQIMTGYPTYKPSKDSPDGYAYLTDLDIERHLLDTHESIVDRIISVYRDACDGVPCIIGTKSGGRRLSAYAAYLSGKREYHDSDDEMLLEIFSKKGLSRLDARYELLEGSILDIPTIPISALEEIHNIIAEVSVEKVHTASTRVVVETSQIDDLAIEWDQEGKSQYFAAAHCQATSHRNTERLTVRFMRRYGGVEGYCFNCSEAWWEIEPTEPKRSKRKAQRLHKRDYNVSALLDKIAKAGNFISDFLRKPAQTIYDRIFFTGEPLTLRRVFGLRAETGAGKNYQTDSYVLDVGGILQTVPHTDLAIDLEERTWERLSSAGWRRDAVFRWQGIWTGWKGNPEPENIVLSNRLLCAQPGRVDAYQRKGGNASISICPECPYMYQCDVDGYRSQRTKAKNARAVTMPIPDVFTNPLYRGFTKNMLQFDGAGRLCIVDEADIFSLFVECELKKERLQSWRRMWDKCRLGIFAEDLLTLLEVKQDPFAIGKYINSIPDDEADEIDEQMQLVRIGVTSGLNTEYRILTLDTATREGYYEHGSEYAIDNLPAVDGAFTTFAKLKSFFRRYKRAEDAPMRYHDGVLKWVIPPQLNPKIDKIGFMSATLDLDLFKRVFPQSEVLEVPPAKWESEAEVYQIMTGRYPRTTVIALDENKKFTGLTPTGMKLWQDMIAEIQRTPERKHAIITYKILLDWARLDIEELGITTANFGGVVGLDTEFKDIDVLWVVFAPELPPHETEWRTKMLFGNDTSPLSFERTDGQYSDKRVQQVYDCGITAELTQAVGRVRLNRRTAKVVIITGHHIPHVTDRPQTILYDEMDWEQSGGLDNLTDVVKARETRTISEIAEQENISERAAYYATKEQRKQEKNGRDADIVRRLDAGEKQKNVAADFGLSVKQIRRIYQKSKKGT